MVIWCAGFFIEVSFRAVALTLPSPFKGEGKGKNVTN